MAVVFLILVALYFLNPITIRCGIRFHKIQPIPLLRKEGILITKATGMLTGQIRTGTTAQSIFADFNYYWSRDGAATGSTGSIPELFMTAAEVHFLKAEINALGLGVSVNGATAQTEYNAGVTASVNFWVSQAIKSDIWVVNKPAGLPDAPTMAAFLANPVVAFDASDLGGHGLQQIYAQEWIDMFRQPWEAWTLMRRTGGKTPMDSTNATFYTNTYGSYQRYIYPSSEKQYNAANWQAETGGTDLISTKIWIAQ